MANDYKQDVGKVPLLAALQPFAPALYALARMMDDMKAKHQLQGSADPFNEWSQLPAAKYRMEQALERHLLPEEGTLWDVNTKDGSHLHAVHGLFNLLGAITLHLRETWPPGYSEPLPGIIRAHEADLAPILEAAKADFNDACGEVREGYYCPLTAGHEGAHAWPDMGYRRAEFRANNQTQWAVPRQWWTGDSGTWACTCGAGRPEACTCPQVP